jgi:hypothetical protein
MAGLSVALLCDLLVLVPLAAVARAAAGEAAAWGAAFLWAIHPLAIRLGVQALTDAPTALFVALALWAGLRALEAGRLAWAVGAGASSGLAYLLRPEGIEPALALAVLYAGYGRLSSRNVEAGAASPSALKTTSIGLGKKTLRRVAWTVAPLVGWAVIASPYVIHISAETGSLTLSKKKSTSSLVRSLTPVPESATTSPGVTGSGSVPAKLDQAPPQGMLRRLSRRV